MCYIIYARLWNCENPDTRVLTVALSRDAAVDAVKKLSAFWGSEYVVWSETITRWD